ncbi:MAG: amidase [Dehalococcoidia bacterium]|nr:amidase [Dehalococcoidia bacterium]
MADLDLSYLSIAEASRRIEAKELSPVALTEAVFARIVATDSQVHAYVRLMRHSALEEARAAEGRAQAGARLGPLDGIPIAVKDLFDTAGVVTAAGTGAYAERVPAEDATAVRRLREAGAVILGKTNTHELAMGGTTNNIHFGATRNPWDLRRVPGGSSGGSGAALAAGQALGALGTDTGGSIRIPAAFCSVTGHKPTYGLVGRGGVVPLSLTLDHAGPMARSAEDCALLLDVLAGHDERDADSVDRPAARSFDALTADVRGLRLAIVPSLLEGCDAVVLRNFEASLEVLAGLGVEVGECEPLAGFAGDWRGMVGPILSVEAASYIDDVLARRPGAIGEPVRNRLLAALEVRAVEYAKALETRKRVERAYEAALGRFDAYVLPTSPMVPDEIANDPAAEPATPLKFRNTSVFDHSHQPALSVPNGFDVDGLPTGLQFAAAMFNDALVLRLGHAYQLATDFHTRRPAL